MAILRPSRAIVLAVSSPSSFSLAHLMTMFRGGSEPTVKSTAAALVIQPRRRERALFRSVNIEAAKRSRPSLLRKNSAMLLSAKSIRPSTTSNASSCSFRVGPQQTTKVGWRHAQILGGVGDVAGMPRQNRGNQGIVEISDRSRNDRRRDGPPARAHLNRLLRNSCSSSSCSRATIKLRRNANSNSPAGPEPDQAEDEAEPARREVSRAISLGTT